MRTESRKLAEELIAGTVKKFEALVAIAIVAVVVAVVSVIALIFAVLL